MSKEQRNKFLCCGGQCNGSGCAIVTASVLVVLLAIAFALGDTVGAQGIGNDEMRNARLSITSMTIMEPDGEAGFTAIMNGTISNLHPLGALVHAFPVEMRYQGRLFGTTTLPEMQLEADETNEFASVSRVNVSDLTVYGRFSGALMTQKTVQINLNGHPTVTSTVGKIQKVLSNLVFDKDVVLQGSNDLPDNSVIAFSLDASNATSINSVMEVSIFNPGVVTALDMGALCFRAVYEGTVVGTMVSDEGQLLAGWNNMTLRGPLLDRNNTVMSAVMSRYLAQQPTPVAAQGVACEQTQPLFRDAISAVAIDTVLPGSPVSMIAAMDLSGMAMLPSAAQPDLVGLLLNTSVVVASPLGADSPLGVETVAIECSLVADGVVVGQLSVPALAPTPAGSSGEFPGIPAGFAAVRVNLTDAAGSLDISKTEAEFVDFVNRFIASEQVTLSMVSAEPSALRSRVRTAIGTFDVQVPIQASTRVPGVNDFPDTTATSFNVVGQAGGGSKAEDVEATVVLHNPSIATVTLGKQAKFGIYFEGERLGFMDVDNTVIGPGANSMSMAGELLPVGNAALAATGRLFSNYLNGVGSEVSCLGESIVLDDGPAPSWLTQVITNITLPSMFPGVQGLDLLTDVNIAVLNLDFPTVPTGPNPDPVAHGRVTMKVHVPFPDIYLNITAINVTFDYVNPSTLDVMASVTAHNVVPDYRPFHPVPPLELVSPATSDDDEPAYPATGTLAIDLPPSQLDVVREQEFALFINQTVNAKVAPVVLRSHTNQTVDLSFGSIVITDIYQQQTLDLPGMNGFQDPPVHILATDVIAAPSNESLLMTMDFVMSNPSPLGGNMGPVSFNVFYEGHQMAVAHLADMNLVQGDNHMTATAVYTPPPEYPSVALNFMSAYLTGKPSAVEMRGSPTSTPYTLLGPSMQSFYSATSLPGVPLPMIVNATLLINEYHPIRARHDLPGIIQVRNVFSVEMELVGSKLQVYLCDNVTETERHNHTVEGCAEFGAEVGLYTKDDLMADPIVLPNKSQVWTPKHNFWTEGNFFDQTALIAQIEKYGAAETAINGTVTARLGGKFTALTVYSQANILTNAVGL